MGVYRYPASSLVPDSLRAILGITATLGPLLFLAVAWPFALILGSLGVVFLAFAVRLILQSLSSFELSDGGISRHGPTARNLSWPEITSLKLAHYGMPRRSSVGWYQLRLKGRDGVLKIDSTIDGFDEILASAVRGVAKRGLTFDPATAENLKSLGHGASGQSLP
ncbi:MAG: hypothetical protein AAGA21_03535 [Pseudomonadota bacterium]